MSTGYGRTGNLTMRSITLAVVSAYPTSASAEVTAQQRLLAVLAASASDSGKVTVNEQEAFAGAALTENRNSRKAWTHVSNQNLKQKNSKPVLNPSESFPIILADDTDRLVILDRLHVNVEADHLDDLDQWVTVTMDDLIGRGLPTWQRETAASELARTVASTSAAVEPGRTAEHAANVAMKVQALLVEIEQARKKVDQTQRRKTSLADSEQQLRAEISAMEVEIHALGDSAGKVAIAVNLANEVLAAAALMAKR